MSETALSESIQRAQNQILSQQFSKGFWWYTLEANETIGAEFIFLLHYLKIENQHQTLIEKLAVRMLGEQRADGSWSLYHDGPGDISTTAECYLALKLARHTPEEAPLQKAREFILSQGGLLKVRVFTKIHFALLGLMPWSAVPELPVWFMNFPNWFFVNIYEFSSWARACVVPLLIVLYQKKTVLIQHLTLEELYWEPAETRDYRFKKECKKFSYENFFIQNDRFLKWITPKIPLKKWSQKALKKAEDWIIHHVEKTEDIFPALAYAIFALTALGRPIDHPTIQKAFSALLFFQQNLKDDLPALPSLAHARDDDLHHSPQDYLPPPPLQTTAESAKAIHQQCCISPVWDTPWAMDALLKSGLAPSHPALKRAARWLISKEIQHTFGDWSVKNKQAGPGGWSFEFQNEYFPDVDDTLQILWVLNRVDLPKAEVTPAFQRGLDWLLSMQSQNGGWGAFDVDNTKHWINKIPFADHGACLDPPSPDLTGRVLGFLGQIGFRQNHPRIAKATRYLLENQKENGSFWARWAVSYLFGSWSVIEGLTAIGLPPHHPAIVKAADWIESVQRVDGGWGESCASDAAGHYVEWKESNPSQTAWAISGLIAAGRVDSEPTRRGISFLIDRQNACGVWDEKAYTGTGFPVHFYIRYHGYRHYFPLLALGTAAKNMKF